MRNLKLALRTLARSPFVTTVTVLSLALGIGANTAIFSLFNEMLLRSLPVPHPEELVNVAAPGPTPGSHQSNASGDNESIFSYAMFRDLEQKQTVFTGLAGFHIFNANVALRGQTVNSRVVLASGSYFPTLGLRAAVGRLLLPSDDQTIGGSSVAVLSYAFWSSHFGADPRVVGEKMLFDGKPFTVVGVAPKGFDGTTLGEMPNVYIPISMRGVVSPLFHGFGERRTYWIYLFGRRKPGVSLQQAQTAINAISRPIINDVEAPLQVGASPQTLARFKARTITLTDGRLGQSVVRAARRTSLYLLLGITGIVLLIACANIANLLLARGASRETEMALRLSLGATRSHLLAQLLTESCSLAALGGLASLVVARLTLDLLRALLPATQAASLHFRLDGIALAFVAVLSLATGLAFGLFPALNATRPDLVEALRSGVGKHSGSRAAARFRSGLVTAQIALSMTLLICAGLFVQSLRNLSRVDLGIDINKLVTFGLSPSLNGYAPASSRQLFQSVEREMKALPGVTNVAVALVAQIAGDNWDNSVSVEGFKKNPDTDDDANFNEVSPGYFQAMGIPLVAGREFNDGDVVGSTRVAIVNEAFAKKFQMGNNVVGKMIGQHVGDTLDVRIVGLVKNTKYSGVRNVDKPIYVLPYRQDSTIGSVNFYVRTASDPAQLVRTVPRVIARLDPNLPVEDPKTMTQQVAENIYLDRMVSTLSAGFATLATLLAAIGLYGVLAYSVAQRTREIGVRMALGANAGRVRAMILRQVGVMTLVGGGIGVAAALLIGRYAASILFQLRGFDLAVTLISAFGLAAVALTAGYLPARKASRIDPTHALRYE